MASDAYNTGVSNVNSANSTGSSAINSFDPNAWQSNTQAGLNGITSSQAQGNQSLVNAFKNQISSQPSATDYYNQGMQNFNVQGLQNTSNNLNNAMLQAPNSNLNAAKGFNYDQNQVDQKTSQDLQRLAPSAAAAQNNASTAQTNAINFANNGIQQNQLNMTPYQQQATAQAQLYAQQYSGFTATAQAQLASLQQKMQSGVSLSTQEMQSYAALTSSEQTYQAQLATNATTIANTIQNQTAMNVAPQNKIVNATSQQILSPNTGSVTSY